MDSLKLNNQSGSLIDNDPLFLNNEEIYGKLKKILSLVFNNRDCWPFREPVNEKDAPNYFEVIKCPMDLSVVNQKLSKKVYTNFLELENDMRLMVNNSENYNGQFNGFTTNAYSVWRTFRRLTKKYLNHDLSMEDKDAFIYPPRYNCTIKSGLSIGGKTSKKRKKQKNSSSKFQALELLYNATQDSIESTFQKFAFSPMSDNENKHDNLPKKYQFTSEEKPMTGFYNAEFANLDNYSNLDGYYTAENRNENLVFKSLNEWNKQIDENNLTVVLPEKAIIVDNSPVDKNWLTNFHPNDQLNYKTVFNKTMYVQPVNGQLENGHLVMTQESVFCSNSKTSKPRKCSNPKTKSKAPEKVPNEQKEPVRTGRTTNNSMSSMDLDQPIPSKIGDENLKLISKKRLVIKLSKLNNDWKPINNDNDEELNQESGSESDSSSDSSCSSGCSCDND